MICLVNFSQELEHFNPCCSKSCSWKTAGSHPNSRPSQHGKRAGPHVLLEALVGDEPPIFCINLREPHINKWPECWQSVFLLEVQCWVFGLLCYNACNLPSSNVTELGKMADVVRWFTFYPIQSTVSFLASCNKSPKYPPARGDGNCPWHKWL